MILHYHFVISLFVIVTVVIFVLRGTLNLLSLQTHKVDFLVVKYLTFFIVSELVQKEFESFTWSHWEFL